MKPLTLGDVPVTSGVERDGPWRAPDGAILDSADDVLIPPTAGDYRNDWGVTVIASLIDARATGGLDAGSLPADNDDAGAGGLDVAAILAALILIALLVEWFCFRTGKIP